MNKKSKSSKKSKRNTLARRGDSLEWDVESKGEFPYKLAISRNMRLHSLHRPLGPWQGAQLSLKLQPSTFTSQTGLSNVGGSSAPAQLIQNSATFLNVALAFQLADIAGISSLAAVFDQYRIDMVLVRFKARNNAVFVANTASPNGAVPTGYIMRDLDDNSTASVLSDYLEYDTVETFNGEEDVVVELRPSITKAAFASGAFSGYSVDPAGWLDMANTSIPHYGLKIGIGGLTATTTSSWAWDVTAEYIVSFNNAR